MDGVMEISKNMKMEKEVGFGKSQVFVRVLAFLLTLVAAIVIGVDNQTKIVPLTVSLDIPVIAKWHYLSAFVYFLTANIITSSYGFLSLFFTITNKNRNNSLILFVIILDIMMVALLFSGNGAAAAVGLIAYQGNSHVQWVKVCNVFGKFCNQAAAAIVLSLAGAMAFMLLILMAAVGLQKRSK